MRVGQALERVNRVLEASWDRRKGFWSRLEANLKRLGGLREAFGGCHRQAQASFSEGPCMVFIVFFVFCRGHKPKVKISKNIDFPGGKLIFLRVGALKNLFKIDKNLMLEALMRKKIVSGAKKLRLGGQKFRFWHPR